MTSSWLPPWALSAVDFNLPSRAWPDTPPMSMPSTSLASCPRWRPSTRGRLPPRLGSSGRGRTRRANLLRVRGAVPVSKVPVSEDGGLLCGRRAEGTSAGH